jgi:hypothetical protein
MSRVLMSWSAHDRGVSGLELLLECVPVELLGQFYQRMVEVDDGLEFGLKEVRLNGGNRGVWLHGFSQFLEVLTPLTKQNSFHNFNTSCCTVIICLKFQRRPA